MGFPNACEKFQSAMVAYEENLRAIGRSEITVKNAEQIFRLFSGFMLDNTGEKKVLSIFRLGETSCGGTEKSQTQLSNT